MHHTWLQRGRLLNPPAPCGCENEKVASSLSIFSLLFTSRPCHWLIYMVGERWELIATVTLCICCPPHSTPESAEETQLRHRPRAAGQQGPGHSVSDFCCTQPSPAVLCTESQQHNDIVCVALVWRLVCHSKVLRHPGRAAAELE
jgi:hypothetical protein